MRIIRYTIKDDVKRLLQNISVEHGFGDRDFAVDLFSLFRLKGDGLPTDDLIDKMAAHAAPKLRTTELNVRMFIKKRRAVMSAIKQTVMFRTTVLAYYSEPIDAVKKLLEDFIRVNTLLVESTCNSCTLRKDCEFGKNLSKHILAPNKLMNPDLVKLIHEDCPDKPEFDAEALKEAAEKMREMMKDESAAALSEVSGGLSAEDMQALGEGQAAADAAAAGDGFDDSFNPDMDDTSDTVPSHGQGGYFNAPIGGKGMTKLNDKFVDKLSAESLELWRIAQHLTNTLRENGIDYKDSPVSQDKRDITNIKKPTDVSAAHKHQMALPEDVFDKKLASNDLTKRHNFEPDAKKQLLFILHDISYSMSSMFMWNSETAFTSHAMAQAMSLAFLKRVEEDNGIFCYAPFAGAIGRITEARTKVEFDKIRKKITKQGATGSGTDVQAALFSAMDFIGNQTGELKRAEVLLLSDGLSSLNQKEIEARKTATGVKIHSVYINCYEGSDYMTAFGHDYNKEELVLKNVSDSFFMLQSGNVSVSDFIDGIKQAR